MSHESSRKEACTMATRKHSLLPLLDIQSAAFTEGYERGVWWSMYGEGQGRGPFSIRSLRTNLERYSAHRSCEQQDPSWRHHIGFFIGMYHGSVLSPHTGQLRPNVSALIVLDSPDTTHGYSVGREAFFHEVEPRYRYSEHTLIEHLHELIREEPCWKEPEEIWDYALGCLLGELSGFLFPETPEEVQAWQETCRIWEARERQSVKVVQQSALLQEA
jgi:hypothetical protein